LYYFYANNDLVLFTFFR
jgi:hypothetical protein